MRVRFAIGRSTVLVTPVLVAGATMLGVWSILPGVQSYVTVTSPREGTGLGLAHAGELAGKGASGELTLVAPANEIVAVMESLSAEAGRFVEDGYEDNEDDIKVNFAVIVEMANLQTLRSEGDIKAWATKLVNVYKKGISESLDEKDAKAILKEGKPLLAEGVAAAGRWASAKPATGMYKTVNADLKLLMSFVSRAHSKTRKAIGQPGQNLQKAMVPADWASAEIGNVTMLFSKEKDWRDWSSIHRDRYVEVAGLLAKGDPNGARKPFDQAQANCKSCHDKYQSDAPIGAAVGWKNDALAAR